MAHNIDFSNNRANIAFIGDRKDVWHRLGTAKQEGASIESWATDAGLAHNVIKVPVIANLTDSAFGHLDEAKRFTPVDNCYLMARDDTGSVLSTKTVSDIYQVVQPREILDFCHRYVGVDDRFVMDTAGALEGGRTVWASAVYRDPLEVAGEKHQARLLASTTFDGSGSTTIQGTIIRVVCRNTINAAHSDTRAVVRVRHSTTFDHATAARQLAGIAKSFATFKAMGDAMAQAEMSKEEVSRFFKQLLDIPFDAPSKDVSARKRNQFDDLTRCYRRSVEEGAPAGTAWSALQAITRYTDHERSTRGGNAVSELEARFNSATFGSGNAMKGEAMGLLLPRIKDKVAVAA